MRLAQNQALFASKTNGQKETQEHMLTSFKGKVLSPRYDLLGSTEGQRRCHFWFNQHDTTKVGFQRNEADRSTPCPLPASERGRRRSRIPQTSSLQDLHRVQVKSNRRCEEIGGC